MNASEHKVPEELSTLGATIQFAVQRFLYLHQHPDGKPGQSFVWDDEAAIATSCLTGALFDLLLDAFGGDLPSTEDFQALLTDNGMEVRVKTRRDPNDSRPGIQLLSRMASSVLLAPGSKELVISVTGTSVDAGFPRWTA